MLSRDGFRVFGDIVDIPDMSVLEQLMSLPETIGHGLTADVGNHDGSKKICIFGIGHSSIVGDIISAYADYFSDIPVVSMSDGIISGWVGKDTDVIIVSYTGNNTMVNDMYESLKDRSRTITCVTGGGPLLKKCQHDGNMSIILPKGLTSRTALGFEIGILASIVQKMGVKDICNHLNDIIPSMKEYRDSLFSDPRVEDLIKKLEGNAVAFYGSPDLRASYRRWKMSYNADTGSPAFCGELPEFNHNEIVGWGNHNQKDDDLRIVFLRGKYKNEVFTKITDKTLEVMEEYQRHVMDINILGDEPLEKNIRTILLADYVSQIIGIDNGGHGNE